MTDELIAQLARQIAVKILKRPNRVIKPDEPLITSGLIDSQSLVDVAILVEELFGVRIEDTELTAETFDTLEQLADLVKERM